MKAEHRNLRNLLVLSLLFALGATGYAANVWDTRFGDYLSGGLGLDETVYAIAAPSTGGETTYSSSKDLYVGGWFTHAGPVEGYNLVAKWNGTRWSVLGEVDGTIYAIAASGSNVFVGGYFSNVNGVPANNIAQWNGTAWSGLGSGMDNTVRAIAINGNTVYAGGNFGAAGGTTVNYVAKWNGISWSALSGPQDIGVDGTVRAIAVYDGNVYVAGDFWKAGGLDSWGIAKWSGSTWVSLGSGLCGDYVDGFCYSGGFGYALAIGPDGVYVGGDFTTVNGTPAQYLARWNGMAWSQVGTGLNGPVNALATGADGLYVGGQFSNAGSVPANNIARWNSTGWSAVGSGTEIGKPIHAVAVNALGVYVGGEFTTAGGHPSLYFGRWGVPFGLWRDAADLGDGWKWLDWFGYYNTTYDPWIYHQQHAWLYPVGADTSNVWLWDSGMGKWWWTSAAIYPYGYRVPDSSWLWYQKDTANPRRFYNFTGANWETW